jgi:hypothetical protein
MKKTTTFKCLHCKEKHICDYRNRGRQRYCSKPECQKASKAASQRQWAGRKENEKYFCGAENCERVRLWRKAHPGYWRKRKASQQDALQETLDLQETGGERVAPPKVQNALQDICNPHPALLVGLISVLTGHALQEDIAASARSFLHRGEDILRMMPGGSSFMSHENQTHFMSRTSEACAQAI